MIALYIIAGFALVGVVAWLVTNGVWMVARWLGRRTHVDERVDRFFDVDGGLDTEDYLKFKEQHPHDGGA